MNDLTSLLTDSEWLRPLAFRLAGPDDADDALQHAWLAHRRHRGAVQEPRAWLAAVFTNFGRSRRRDAARRARHEHARELGRPATALPTDELVARMELQQRVAAAVLALEEPYRGTVLLHFVDGLSTKEIADRSGEPWATVRSRLARGLDRLRAALARERSDWRDGLALAVFGVPSHRLARPPAAMASLAAVLGLTALAAGAGWFVLASGAGAVASGPETAAAETAPVPKTAPASGGRQALAPGLVPPPAALAEPAAALTTYRGQLLDPRGKGLAGIGVFVRGERIAVTDDAGGFTAVLPGGEHEVDTDDQHRILWAAPLRTDGPNRFLATRRVRVVGEVVDEDGRPIDGARLCYQESTPVDYPHPLHGLARRDVATRQIARDGRFDFAVPWLEGASLSAQADGHQDGSIDFGVGGGDGGGVIAVAVADTAADRPRLRTQPTGVPTWRAEVKARFVLARQPAVSDPAWRSWVIEGVVLDAGRRPVADAVVSWLAVLPVRSGADGTFRIETGASNLLDGCSLIAFHPQHGVAAVERPQERWRTDPERKPYETLQLCPADGELRGRVVDAAGKPVAGRMVRVADPLVAPDQDGLRILETLAFQEGSTTDADGQFTLRGLMPRAHRLAVLDPATLHWFEAGPFAADAHGVSITVPPPVDLRPEWRGRVVDAHGRPVAGARVTASLWVTFAGVGSATAHATTSVAGEDGLVVLPPQCAQGVTVTFEAPGRMLEVRARGRLDTAVVPLGRIAYVHYRGAAAPPSSNQRRLEVLDAEGRPLPLEGPYMGGLYRSESYWMTGRKTAVLATSELAATLVIYTDDGASRRNEPHRFPIRLVPGEVTVID